MDTSTRGSHSIQSGSDGCSLPTSNLQFILWMEFGEKQHERTVPPLTHLSQLSQLLLSQVSLSVLGATFRTRWLPAMRPEALTKRVHPPWETRQPSSRLVCGGRCKGHVFNFPHEDERFTPFHLNSSDIFRGFFTRLHCLTKIFAT